MRFPGLAHAQNARSAKPRLASRSQELEARISADPRFAKAFKELQKDSAKLADIRLTAAVLNWIYGGGIMPDEWRATSGAELVDELWTMPLLRLKSPSRPESRRRESFRQPSVGEPTRVPIVNPCFAALFSLQKINRADDFVRRVGLDHANAQLCEALAGAFLGVENRCLRDTHFPGGLRPFFASLFPKTLCENRQILFSQKSL